VIVDSADNFIVIGEWVLISVW